MCNTEGCKPFTGNRAKKVPFVILFSEIDFFVFIFPFFVMDAGEETQGLPYGKQMLYH